MAAAAPLLIPVVLSGVSTAIQYNQQRKAQEGAENAAKDQQKEVAQARALEAKKEQDNLLAKQNTAGAGSKAAMDAIRAALSANNSNGGTILTSGQGTAPAPTASKTLLGQ